MSMVDPEGRGLPLNMRHVARTLLTNTVPRATNPAISGGAIVGVQQTGTYTYTDTEGDAEGASTYRWLRDGVAIGGATAITYTPVGTDYGHTLTFEVTPRAATGLTPGVAATSAGSVVTFTTASVPNIGAWYDLADITTVWKDTARTSAVTTNGDVIKGVTDKSGNAKHLSEATNGPAYTTGVQNSLAAARFDGVNDLLTSIAVLGITSPWTILCAGVQRSAPAAGVEKSMWEKSSSAHSLFSTNATVHATNALYRSNNAGAAVQQAGYTVTSFFINATTYTSAASIDIRKNGGASFGNFDPHDNGALSSVVKFGQNAHSGNFGDWDIGEFIICSSALSLANLDLVGGYLATRWGLTWTAAS